MNFVEIVTVANFFFPMKIWDLFYSILKGNRKSAEGSSYKGDPLFTGHSKCSMWNSGRKALCGIFSIELNTVS